MSTCLGEERAGRYLVKFTNPCVSKGRSLRCPQRSACHTTFLRFGAPVVETLLFQLGRLLFRPLMQNGLAFCRQQTCSDYPIGIYEEFSSKLSLSSDDGRLLTGQTLRSHRLEAHALA